MNKKKIIIISIISVLLIVAVAIGIYMFVENKNKEQQNISIVNEIYSDLQSREEYTFEEILDENNRLYYAKSQDKAYLEITTDGKKAKYIIKDNNTYYLDEENKVYYTYLNDQENVNMIMDKLIDLKDLEYTSSIETIGSKNYFYQQYENVDYFLFDTSKVVENEENVSTIFYYKNKKLEYIRTIEGEETELLKVNITYDVNQNLFEIPEGYVQK